MAIQFNTSPRVGFGRYEHVGRLRYSTRNIRGISLRKLPIYKWVTYLSKMAMFNGCIRLPEETFEGQIGKSRQTIIFEESWSSRYFMWFLSFSKLWFLIGTSLQLPVWRVCLSNWDSHPKRKMTSSSNHNPVKNMSSNSTNTRPLEWTFMRASWE